MVVFKHILHSTVIYPEHFSPEVCDLLDGLLDRCPETRIPCGEGGFASLKGHAFFDGIDWERLALHELLPPPGLMQRLRNSPMMPAAHINHTLAGSRAPPWLADF
jgi:hypothetical protein